VVSCVVLEVVVCCCGFCVFLSVFSSFLVEDHRVCVCLCVCVCVCVFVLECPVFVCMSREKEKKTRKTGMGENILLGPVGGCA
jgi:hypothetical protein